MEKAIGLAGDRAELIELGRTDGGRPVLLARVRTTPAPEAPCVLVASGVVPGDVLGPLAALTFLESVCADVPTGVADLYVLAALDLDLYERAMAGGGDPGGGVLPDDADRDGRTDEDGPDDLNGDGLVAQMAILDPEGDVTIDPMDGRVMVSAAGMGPRWRVIGTEGIDDDGDGRINEDDAGGLAPNLNFPSGWARAEAVDRYGSRKGLRPCAVGSVRSVVDWLVDRDEIAVAFVLRGGGEEAALRPAATAEELDGRAEAGAHDAVAAAFRSEGRDGAEAEAKDPGPDGASGGGLASFLWSRRGVPTFTVGLWDLDRAEALLADDEKPNAAAEASAADSTAEAPVAADDDSEDLSTEVRWARWSDRVPGGVSPLAWTRQKHPDLGEVWIGGDASPFTRMNPPGSSVAEIADDPVAFLRQSVGLAPEVTARGEVRRVEGGALRVEVRVRETGALPVYGDRARELRVGSDLWAELSFDTGRLLAGFPRVRVDADGEGWRRATWLVSDVRPEDLSVDIRAGSIGRRSVDLEVVQ